MSDQDRNVARGEDVLRFLNHHRLSHDPEHYAFAYAYLAGANASFRAAVDRVTDDGVRLTQANIRQLTGAGDVGHKTPTLRRLMPDIDHVALRVLDVVGDTLTATSDFSRSLVAASASLTAAKQVDVPALVSLMVERAERAEATLADSARRVRDLRSELRALQDADRRDALTGLLNQVAVEERLGTATASATCLALVDVNGLRRINDGHSHAVGDRLLKVVAAVLTEACAPHLVARWEGGTFAVLLDGVTLDRAASILNDACEAVAAKRMRVRENDAPLGAVTITAGIVATRQRDVRMTSEAALRQLRHAKDRRGVISVEDRLVTVT